MITKAIAYIGFTILPLALFGQSSFIIGIESTTLINTINYVPQFDDLKIEGKRGRCFGFHLAYQKNLNKRLYINAGTRILFLNSRVDLNIDANGYNEQSEIYYDKVSDRNPTDYFTGAGIVLQAGYDMSLTTKSAVGLVFGIHADFPIIPNTENMSFLNNGKQTELVYYENLTDPESYQTVYMGVDLSVRYNIRISERLVLFAGPAVTIYPGQYFKGTFQVYPTIPKLYNYGTFSLNPSYAGVVVGTRLSK